MTLLSRVFSSPLSQLSSAVTDLAEVFRPNAEASAGRAHAARGEALAQLAAEFGRGRTGWFDALIDGLNRLPRPAMAMGTIGLFIYALIDPIGFAARMQGLAVVPEPLWWLMGAIVSFYFGARELHHARRTSASDIAEVTRVAQSIARIEALRPAQPTSEVPDIPLDRSDPDRNAQTGQGQW